VLGPLRRGELAAQIVRTSGIELVLVEVGGEVRRILFIRQLTGVLMPEPGKRVLDPRAVGGEKFACPIRIHRADVTGLFAERTRLVSAVSLESLRANLHR